MMPLPHSCAFLIWASGAGRLRVRLSLGALEPGGGGGAPNSLHTICCGASSARAGSGHASKVGSDDEGGASGGDGGAAALTNEVAKPAAQRQKEGAAGSGSEQGAPLCPPLSTQVTVASHPPFVGTSGGAGTFGTTTTTMYL